MSSYLIRSLEEYRFYYRNNTWNEIRVYDKRFKMKKVL